MTPHPLVTSFWQAAAQTPDCPAFIAQVQALLGGDVDLMVMRLGRAGRIAELEAGPGQVHRRDLSTGDWVEI